MGVGAATAAAMGSRPLRLLADVGGFRGEMGRVLGWAR